MKPVLKRMIEKQDRTIQALDTYSSTYRVECRTWPAAVWYTSQKVCGRSIRFPGAADAAVCAGGAATGRVSARGALVVLSLVLAAPHWPGAAHVSLIYHPPPPPRPGPLPRPDRPPPTSDTPPLHYRTLFLLRFSFSLFFHVPYSWRNQYAFTRHKSGQSLRLLDVAIAEHWTKLLKHVFALMLLLFSSHVACAVIISLQKYYCRIWWILVKRLSGSKDQIVSLHQIFTCTYKQLHMMINRFLI